MVHCREVTPGLHGMLTKRKTIRYILGVAILGGVFHLGAWPFVIGGRNMQAFCDRLIADVPLSRVRELAVQNGYRMTEPGKEGRALIHDSRSFGRFICEVQFKGEALELGALSRQ